MAIRAYLRAFREWCCTDIFFTKLCFSLFSCTFSVEKSMYVISERSRPPRQDVGECIKFLTGRAQPKTSDPQDWKAVLGSVLQLMSKFQTFKFAFLLQKTLSVVQEKIIEVQKFKQESRRLKSGKRQRHSAWIPLRIRDQPASPSTQSEVSNRRRGTLKSFSQPPGLRAVKGADCSGVSTVLYPCVAEK